MKSDKVNSNKLTIRPTESKAKYNITFNDRVVAEVLLDVDGFYYIDFVGSSGWWNSYQLRDIANMVMELNRPQEKELNEYFRRNGLDQDKFIDF